MEMRGFYKSKKVAKVTAKALGPNYSVFKVKGGFGLFRRKR